MLIRTLLLVAASTIASVADAQTYYARQKLMPGIAGTPTAQAPTPTPAAWTPGTWSSWSSECSDSAQRLRTVTCVENGAEVADSRCTGTKPQSSEGPVGRYDGCEFSYRNGYLNQVGSNSYCSGGVKQYNIIQACFTKGDYNFANRQSDTKCAGLAKPASRITDFPCTNVGVQYSDSVGNGNSANIDLPVGTFDGILTAAQAKAAGLAMCDARAQARFGTTGTTTVFCHFRRYATSASLNRTQVEAGLRDETVSPSQFPTGGDWKTIYTGNASVYPASTIRVSRPVTLPDDYDQPCGNRSSAPYWLTQC